jgi:hypothetical protein
MYRIGGRRGLIDKNCTGNVKIQLNRTVITISLSSRRNEGGIVDNFKIDILNHCWIDNDPENVTDECSHGQFILTIAGQRILDESDDILNWTTSTSVLRLLRTIEEDFVEDREPGIILHCGMIQMISCPIAIDWILQHEEDKVIIKEVKKYLSTSDECVVDYKGLVGVIDVDEYKSEILKVARQVKEFFARSKPRRLAEADIKCNFEFWKEFDGLVNKYSI